ncbi:MAG: hypothetical protein RRY21_07305, partial [Oscillospiraceae bacterium]
ANRVALETGQTTLQRICAARGEDYRDTLSQRARELTLMETLGITKKEEKTDANAAGGLGSGA